MNLYTQYLYTNKVILELNIYLKVTSKIISNAIMFITFRNKIEDLYRKAKPK